LHESLFESPHLLR